MVSMEVSCCTVLYCAVCGMADPAAAASMTPHPKLTLLHCQLSDRVAVDAIATRQAATRVTTPHCTTYLACASLALSHLLNMFRLS